MTRSAPAGASGTDLAQTWRNAAAFLPHLAGCACAGPHLMLDRTSVEADLLAYLADLYRNSGRAALVRLIEAREDESAPQISFAAWLGSLDAMALDAEDRTRLLSDLKKALDSLDAAKSAGGFICE